MATSTTYTDDGRTEFDDETRTATEYDADGELIRERPFTAEENAKADAADVQELEQANKSTIETNLDADLAAMQAIKDQTNADLRADPSQEIKEIAVAVRRLIKMSLNDFSEPE